MAKREATGRVMRLTILGYVKASARINCAWVRTIGSAVIGWCGRNLVAFFEGASRKKLTRGKFPAIIDNEGYLRNDGAC